MSGCEEIDLPGSSEIECMFTQKRGSKINKGKSWVGRQKLETVSRTVEGKRGYLLVQNFEDVSR